jgi:hypothetical protein
MVHTHTLNRTARMEYPTATTGGSPEGSRPELPINTFDTGTRMVLDTEIHWTWRNPLNLIPASILFGIFLGVVAHLARAIGL